MAMKEYLVNMLVDATVPLKIKANSAEEAAAKAYETTGVPSLCHQCSDDLEVGDIVGCVVATAEGEEAYDDSSYSACLTELRQLQAELSSLREEAAIAGQVREMLSAWHDKRKKAGLKPLTTANILGDLTEILTKFEAKEWALTTIKQDEMKGLKKLPETPAVQFLSRLGACPTCLQVNDHWLDEPFSSCLCGTGEDSGRAPLQHYQRLKAAASALAVRMPTEPHWYAAAEIAQLNLVLQEELTCPM